MRKIKIGQIGIGHNHGEGKMKAVRKFPELFEVVGYAEENEEWIKARENLPAYQGLKRWSVEELLKNGATDKLNKPGTFKPFDEPFENIKRELMKKYC